MKVSTCLATYNGERYLPQQLDSILQQLKTDDQLVIVDDASVDRSVEIVKEYADPRIVLTVNSHNLGVVRSIERAVQASTGDVVFLADQDDIWLPNKVTRTLESMGQTGSYAVVTDASIIDGDGQPMRDSHFAIRNSGPGVLKNWWRNSYVGCCMAFDARIKPLILPFPLNIPMHDMWIGAVCDFVGDVHFLPIALTCYRRHSSNATPLASRDVLKMARYRLKLLLVILKHFPHVEARAKNLGLWKN